MDEGRAGNFWLQIALVVRLGGSAERYEPARNSFWGFGWWDPILYNFAVILLFVFGLFLITTAGNLPEKQKAPPPFVLCERAFPL